MSIFLLSTCFPISALLLGLFLGVPDDTKPCLGPGLCKELVRAQRCCQSLEDELCPVPQSRYQKKPFHVGAAPIVLRYGANDVLQELWGCVCSRKGKIGLLLVRLASCWLSRENRTLKSLENTPLALPPSEKPCHSAYWGLITAS